jgi:uncharacterized membrane protein YccC
MSEQIQRIRGTALALVAGGLALAAVVANLVHTGKVLWGGLVVLVLAAWILARNRS